MATSGVLTGASSTILQPSSGPYIPTTWGLGGGIVRHIDIPITSVLLVLYFACAVSNIIIFKKNMKRGHKFFFGVALVGFNMSRVATSAIRLASMCHPTNSRLAIAAAIFVTAGVLVLFIINLMWSIRILRAIHPKIGWHPAVGILMKIYYVLTFLTFVMVLTATVQSFFTLRPRTRQIDRDIQLYSGTFLAILSSAPLFVLGIGFAIPRHTSPETFGAGRFRTKVFILLIGTTLVSSGAWYRCITSWQTPVQRTEPLPAYFHKAAFYIFNFAVEIIAVYFYLVMRVDLRFWVPNGAKGPGDYSSHTGDTPLDSMIDHNEEAAVEKEAENASVKQLAKQEAV